MSITFVRLITGLGTCYSAAAGPGTNQVTVCCSGSANVAQLQVWDVSTGLMSQNPIPLAATTQFFDDMVMVNGASAFGSGNRATAECQLVNLSGSNNITTNTSWLQLFSQFKSQQIAICQGNVILATTNGTTGTLNKFVLPNTTTNGQFAIMPAGGAKCVITDNASGFFIGTDTSTIIRVDSSINVVDTMVLSIRGYEGAGAVTNQGITVDGSITYMAYSDPYIFAITHHGELLKIHWPTKTILEIQTIGVGDTARGAVNPIYMVGNSMIMVSANGGATTPTSSGNNGGAILELDPFTSPMEVRDVLYSVGVGDFMSAGTTLSGTYQWALNNNSTLALTIFQVTQKSVTTETASILDPSATKGRVIRIIDDGDTRVEVDSAVRQGNDPIPVTSGKAVIDIVMYGEGVNEKASVSLYNS